MEYILMHKNVPVALLSLDEDDGHIIKVSEVYNEAHLPVGVHVRRGVVDAGDLKVWWNDRSIPASRSGINKALAVLNVTSTRMLLTKCLGLSLSDQYWIKPANQNVEWSQVNFFDNPFSEDIGDILLGKAIHSNNISLHSPDNTSDGCLKKRWKIIDGKRCLIKGGSNPFVQQPFNEVVATVIARALNIPHIPYWVIWDEGKPYSVCEDFITSETELVSAWRVMQTQKQSNSISVYRHYLNCCEAMGVKDAELAVNQMIVLDYLVANEDRHQNNFGLIRNAETLEWIGPAPIYDTGSSLGYEKLPKQIIAGKEIECKPFKKKHEEQIKLVSSFEWLDISALDDIEAKIREVFREAVEKSDTIDEERVTAIVMSVKRRIERLKAIIAENTAVDNIEDDVTEDVAETYVRKENK